MATVLIVEDDLLIAYMVEEFVIAHGYQTCGIARTVAEAVVLARQHKPDLAVIDLRLADGGFGTEIVAQLAPLDRPGILFATGNAAQFELTTTDGDACLDKPFRAADLIRGLEVVAGIVTTGIARPPFPPGFRVLPVPANATGVPTHG